MSFNGKRHGVSCYNGGMENEPVQFGAFDPAAEIHFAERNLPHWFQPGATAFVTFRTKDSMPRKVLERWQRELDVWLRERGLDSQTANVSQIMQQWPRPVQNEYRRLRNRLWHFALDECHGACVLRRPELAAIVSKSLLHFDGERYNLDSFVVLPNHIHLLVQMRASHTLAKQVESWLRYTGRQINERLGVRGAFWQSEPFDHLVRSAEQFEYFRKYIVDNPVKARLQPGEYLYWTRNAK